MPIIELFINLDHTTLMFFSARNLKDLNKMWLMKFVTFSSIQQVLLCTVEENGYLTSIQIWFEIIWFSIFRFIFRNGLY